MKSNLITKLSVAILLITTSLLSCTKDSSYLSDSSKTNPSTANEQGKAAIAEPALPVYYPCGMMVHVWSPKINSPKQFSYAYKYRGVAHYFAINGGPIETFSAPDKFTFEFAGYLNAANTVTSWRIRRIDGKYLTASPVSVLHYQDKLNGTDAVKQIFLFDALGSDTYHLIMPKMPGCRIANIAYSGDVDQLYAQPYDAPYLDATEIIITAASPLVNH